MILLNIVTWLSSCVPHQYSRTGRKWWINMYMTIICCPIIEFQCGMVITWYYIRFMTYCRLIIILLILTYFIYSFVVSIQVIVLDSNIPLLYVFSILFENEYCNRYLVVILEDSCMVKTCHILTVIYASLLLCII